MSTAAIELAGVEKQLGSFHLGPLTLEVPRGAIYGLIGPNGAGKTTTLDLLMGLGQPDGGVVKILGRDLRTDEVEIKRRTAYVSPDLNYQVWGTVGRTLHFISGFYPDWDQERCARLQSEFGVRSEEKVAALSFGARIKLALILALARDAELLLLDEPTLGLDAVSRRQLFTELLAFMQREDRTILISSHQLSDLERFADHAAIIGKGRLLASGRMDQLVERFMQLHVRVKLPWARTIPGAYIVKDERETLHMIVDTEITNVRTLAALDIEILSESPLTLEEVVVALTRSENSRAHESRARESVR